MVGAHPSPLAIVIAVGPVRTPPAIVVGPPVDPVLACRRLEREQELEVGAQVGELCAQACRVGHRAGEDESAFDEEVVRD